MQNFNKNFNLKKTKKQKKKQLTMATFYFKGAQNPWLIDNQN